MELQVLMVLMVHRERMVLAVLMERQEQTGLMELRVQTVHQVQMVQVE